MIRINPRYLLASVTLLLIEVIIAIYIHDDFIRPYIGDMLVVLLVYCLVRIVLPPYRLLPLAVFLFAMAIEIAQLFDFVVLLGLQNNRVLSVVLGSTFDLVDILCYAAGGLLVFIWQRKVCKAS